LKAQGRLKETIERYIGETAPTPGN